MTAIESVEFEIDIFVSSFGIFTIITSENMEKMKNNAKRGCTSGWSSWLCLRVYLGVVAWGCSLGLYLGVASWGCCVRVARACGIMTTVATLGERRWRCVHLMAMWYQHPQPRRSFLRPCGRSGSRGPGWLATAPCAWVSYPATLTPRTVYRFFEIYSLERVNK